MKTIGLIGGMTWESTLEYYRIINRVVRETIGGLHSARIAMHSFDFAEIATLQGEGDWEELTKLMIAAAQRLEGAGADFLAICCNTMHKVADYVQKDIRIPLLHIVDATARQIKANGLKRVGLLGTKATMEEDFYVARLVDMHELEVITPNERERELADNVIYDELCRGNVNLSSREKFVGIMRNFAANGAEGIILGCTEIHLLIDQDDISTPVFDTTAIHAISAARSALELEDSHYSQSDTTGSKFPRAEP
ncbi:MAG: aspartate/glutamate racemase family protein [Planctomycetota bacterium]|jgi:aspartate racemase